MTQLLTFKTTKQMKKIIKNPLFITVILLGCLSLTSCQQADTATSDVKSPNKVRPINNINSALFDGIDFDDIPDVEDDFSALVAQVHNEAVAYMLSYLVNEEYTNFTNTEAENEIIFRELANQCVDEMADLYNVDTTGFSIIANVVEDDVNAYLADYASPQLCQYLHAADSLCSVEAFSALSNLYGTYGELYDDKERLIYKTYIAVAQYSYNYWSLCSFDAFSFLPSDLLIQYQEPDNPPLFDGDMGSINWQNVAKADGRGAVDAVTEGAITHLIGYLIFGTISWAEFAIEVGVHAAIQSFKAYKLESENCTIEIANPDHDYFQDPHSCLYQYLEERYHLYGSEYLVRNWNGRFEFMIDNF